MIGALLLSAVPVAQLPVDLPMPVELSGSNIELTLQATETHFVARNTGESTVVLFFGDPGSDVRSHVRLVPGAERTYTFCRGCLDDVFVEALSERPGPSRFVSTGALSLEDLAVSPVGTMWIQGGESQATGWLAGPGGVELVHPRGTLLPPALHGALSQNTGDAPTRSMHVPVITPEADKDDSKPPVIEPNPLPPV